MDPYLHRRLKNWAAESRPPLDGKERLLAIAQTEAMQRHKRATFAERLGRFFSQPTVVNEKEIAFAPLTQTSVGSFHFLRSLRWVV